MGAQRGSDTVSHQALCESQLSGTKCLQRARASTVKRLAICYYRFQKGRQQLSESFLKFSSFTHMPASIYYAICACLSSICFFETEVPNPLFPFISSYGDRGRLNVSHLIPMRESKDLLCPFDNDSLIKLFIRIIFDCSLSMYFFIFLMIEFLEVCHCILCL